MRPVILVAALLVLSSIAAGCFRLLDVHGCDGEADWVEPGITDWVTTNGFANGFGPPLNATGRIEEVLPNGTMLVVAFRKVEVSGSTVFLVIGGTGGNLNINRPRNVAGLSLETLKGVWDETLDAVYLGSDASRDAAWQVIREDEWLTKDPDEAVFFRIDNAWTFDAVLEDNASFKPAEEGPWQVLKTGEWQMDAAPPAWQRNGPEQGLGDTSHPYLDQLFVGADDRVEIHFFYLDEEQDAKDLVQREVPAFDWTFDGFRFESSCPSPY